MKKIVFTLFTFLFVVKFVQPQEDIPVIELLGEMLLPTSTYTSTYDVILYDQTAFISLYHSQTHIPTVLIIDISNPESPKIISEYQPDIQVEDSTQVNQSNVSTPSLYATKYFSTITLEYPNLYLTHLHGFDAIDISNPTQLTKRHTHQSQQEGTLVAAFGNRIIFFKKDKEIEFITVNQEHEIEHSTTIESTWHQRGWASNIQWDGGDTAYVRLQDYSRSSSGPAAIMPLDLSSFDQPIAHPALDLPIYVSWSQNLFSMILHPLPYILTQEYSRDDRDYNFSIINISDPYNPVISNAISNQPWISNLVTVGNYVLGSNMSGGIVVYKLMDEYPFLHQTTTMFNSLDNDIGFRFLEVQDDILIGIERDSANRNEVFNVFRVQQTSSIHQYEQFK